MAEPKPSLDENKILTGKQQEEGDDGNTQNNPILSFVSNLLQLLKPPAPRKASSTVGNGSDSVPSKIDSPVGKVGAEDEYTPDLVKFPRQSWAPLKLEAEAEGGEQNTNPVILWQVYAIGGFFILRWAWKRWNERKGDKKSSDEPPPAHD